MHKDSYTLPPPVSKQTSRLLKIIPLAAMLAAGFAPAAWAAEACQANADIGSSHCSGSKPTLANPYTGNDDVTVSDNSFEYAYGGWSQTDPVTLNTLTIESGGVVQEAYGGKADSTEDATGNTIIIRGTVGNDATAQGSASGGESQEGSATGNTVILESGTVTRIYGGYSGDTTGTAEATNNTVTLAGGVVTLLQGGYCKSCRDRVTGNTLNVQPKDMAVDVTVKQDVKNFDTLNFTLPADITSGKVMLSVGREATFGESASNDTEVSITVAGAPTLKAGESITLIKANNTLEIEPNFTGSTDGYFEVKKDSAGTSLIAEIKKDLVAIKIDGSTSEGGEVKCEHTEVAQDIGTTTCTATADTAAGYTYAAGSMSASSGTLDCSGNICTLSKVTSDATVSATFTKGGGSTDPGTGTNPGTDPGTGGNPGAGAGGGNSSSPTMGELGLLLSGLALAGAAAPALRRRERKARKQD